LKADGEPADPIRIVNANNERWGNDLIGNGSMVDAKFVVKDYGKGRKKGMYIRAIRVLELVPYVPQDFAPLTSDDEFFAEEATPTTPAENTVEAELQRMDAENEADDDLNDDVVI